MKNILITIFFLFFINIVVYKVTEINSRQKIGMELKENAKLLTTHYRIILYSQNITAKTVYDSTEDQKSILGKRLVWDYICLK